MMLGCSMLDMKRSGPKRPLPLAPYSGGNRAAVGEGQGEGSSTRCERDREDASMRTPLTLTLTLSPSTGRGDKGAADPHRRRNHTVRLENLLQRLISHCGKRHQISALTCGNRPDPS